jgi:hypothetical protein
MTISTETRIAGPYEGNGVTTSFPFLFEVFAADQLKVIRRKLVAPAEADVELSYGSHYGVSLNSDQQLNPGGSVSYPLDPSGDKLPAGYGLVIVSAVGYTQPTDLPSGGRFFSETVERAIDRVVVLAQQLKQRLASALQLADGVEAAPLPSPTELAGRLLQFDEDGQPQASSFTALEVATGIAPGNAWAGTIDAGMVEYNSLEAYTAGTAGRALNDLLAGLDSVLVVDTVADLKASVNNASVAITRGYWELGDGGGGVYFLAPEVNPSPGGNNGTVIERNDTRWYQLYIPGDTVNAKQLGVYTPAARVETAKPGAPGYYLRWTGAKPDSSGLEPSVLPNGYSTTNWLLAADDQVRALGKGLLIDGVVHCDLQVVVDAPTTWYFGGRNGVGTANTDLNMPQSYLFQSNTSMVGSVLCMVTHPGVRFFGGGIIGPVYYDATDDWYYPEGAARDGIFIGANSFAWYGGPVFARMGRDGVRIGDYAGETTTNANGVYLQNPVVIFNGRHGIHISDANGSIDANTFLIEAPKIQWNKETGILFGKSVLGGVVLAPKIETNKRGIFFDADTADISVIGGNVEACTEPLGWQYRPELGPPWDDVSGGINNIETAPQAVGRNFLVNTTVQGVVHHNLAATTVVERDANSATVLAVSNQSVGSGAATQLALSMDQGLSGMWQRAEVDGGELLIGALDHAANIAFVNGGIYRLAILPTGAFSMGGFSNAGTAGQVLTSAGAGAPPTWSTPGGGTTSPLTTKGDLYAFSTVNARLPVGADTHVLSADSSEPTGLKWVAAGTPTIANPLEVAENHADVTKVVVKNLSTSTGASSQAQLITDQGTGGMWQRATVDGGEFLFGTIDHAGDVGLMVNGTIRWGFLPTGALSIGGFSGAGTAGQVLTSAGSGAAAAWANPSPLTTKGDLYTFSTTNARLAKGTDGYVLTADSAEATGLKWAEVTGTGTVTSAAMTVPTGLAVSGSPITAAGTFAVTWASGYQAYTAAEASKLAGLPLTAVSKTGDTMTGDLTVSKVDATLMANATSGNANLVAQNGSVLSGIRSGPAYAEMGMLSAHDFYLLAAGMQRVKLTAGGYIELPGIPTSSPGGTNRLWKDGSGYLRIT